MKVRVQGLRLATLRDVLIEVCESGRGCPRDQVGGGTACAEEIGGEKLADTFGLGDDYGVGRPVHEENGKDLM